MYMGRRSIVTDYLFSVRLQTRGLTYVTGAPARGALLAEGRCCAEILIFYIFVHLHYVLFMYYLYEILLFIYN